MLFSLREVIKERPTPTCVSLGSSIQEALTTMLENDFTQLPVVDQSGRLRGMLTEHGILRRLKRYGFSDRFVSDSIDRWFDKPAEMRADTELIEALKALESTYAVVIVESERPIGILTHEDVAAFLRTVSYGFMLVRFIELALRDYIAAAYPTEQDRQIAISRMRSNSGSQLDGDTDDDEGEVSLTLRGQVSLICTRENWPPFEQYLGDKKAFTKLMNPIPDIRNAIAHFREEEVTSAQWEQLQEAAEYLNLCLQSKPPRLPSKREEEHASSSKASGALEARRAVTMRARGTNRYAPLGEWLAEVSVEQEDVILSFEQIETIIGSPLPPASATRQWWANPKEGHPQSKAWMSAGWKVRKADLEKRSVEFERVPRITGKEGSA